MDRNRSRWSEVARRKFRSPEYRAWTAMKTRCYNPNFPKYQGYGRRGITVCERWRNSFEVFLDDMGFRPTPQHSVDRYPDNDGNYEPGNCRWATRSEQASNRSTNRPITAGGRTMLLKEWAAETGIGETTIIGRLARGWSPERAVSELPRQGGYRTERWLTYNGKRLRLADWARELGIDNHQTITKRLARGWTVAEALGKRRRHGSANAHRRCR